MKAAHPTASAPQAFRCLARSAYTKCLAPFSKWCQALFNGARHYLLTPVLILSLSLPSPAFALRQVGLEESDKTKREVLAQLTNQPQIDEPQLRGYNAYAQALRALTYGAKVTPASRVRLRALREIGPGIEKTVRKLLQNQEIKIAVSPRGSSLRGYAADQSDVEYNVYILSGLGSNQTIDVEMQQQIHAAVDAFLEGRDLQADGYKFTEIENFSGILQGEILPDSFVLESEKAKQRIGEHAGKLFLPVTYGDAELIEKSRRSFLESITPQNIKWQKSVWKLAQHSYLSDAVITEEELNIKSSVKPHFRTWLSDHGVNPASRSAVQKFLQRHRKLVGLPSLEDMKRIYLIGPQLQNSAAGLEKREETALSGQRTEKDQREEKGRKNLVGVALSATRLPVKVP